MRIIPPNVLALVKEIKAASTGSTRLLSSADIDLRLHLFNITNDWDLFKDVCDKQAVSVMYPSLARAIGCTDKEYEQDLIKTFGPLPKSYKELLDANSP